MMARGPLVGSARADERRLVEGAAEELQADGQPFRETARQRQAGQPRQVRGHGEDVGQVHLQGIAGLLADAEGRVGVVGVTITSQVSNASSKSRRMSVRTFCARR